MDSEDLTIWARRAANGDRNALENFLAHIHPILFRYLLRSMRDEREVAADLAQEALIRISVGLPKARATTRAQVIAWSLVVARNVAIDFLRALRREPAEYAGSLTDASLIESTDGDHAPDFCMATLLSILRVAEGDLPDATRRILYLRLLEGAPWPSVAEEMGIAESAAKRRFQRAQARLRRQVLRRVTTLEFPLRTAILDRIRRFGVEITDRSEAGEAD